MKSQAKNCWSNFYAAASLTYKVAIATLQSEIDYDGMNKKDTPLQYLSSRNVIYINDKYGTESNQQTRVDCGDHLSGT